MKLRGQVWGHMWWSSKHLKMFIKYVFEMFWWPSDVRSKLTIKSLNLVMSSSFLMNLLHSTFVWLYDIWQVIGNSLKYYFITLLSSLGASASTSTDVGASAGTSAGQCSSLIWQVNMDAVLFVEISRISENLGKNAMEVFSNFYLLTVFLTSGFSLQRMHFICCGKLSMFK